jgi:hypothetical protein
MVHVVRDGRDSSRGLLTMRNCFWIASSLTLLAMTTSTLIRHASHDTFSRKREKGAAYFPLKSSAPVRSPSFGSPAFAIAASRTFNPANSGRSNRRVMKRRIEVVS